MNPTICPWAFWVACQQIGQAARAVRFDGENIDQSGCRRASDVRRKRAPIVATKTTDLRFNAGGKFFIDLDESLIRKMT
jgi:hypothetical protein